MDNGRQLRTESPTGLSWTCQLTVPPGSVPFYSHNRFLPIFFYGGWASSFAPYRFRAQMLFDTSGVYPTYWCTREHWFQAHKTSELRVVEAIAQDEDPWAAKALGNSRTAFRIRDDWDQGFSYRVMLEGIEHQLRQYSGLAADLAATGERFIAEVSAQGDMVWGIHDPATGTWDGMNWLGAAWMEARAGMAQP